MNAKSVVGMVAVKLAISCAPETGSEELEAIEWPHVPSYVDVGEATCSDAARKRKVDWSSGIHDGCCKSGFITGGSCMYGHGSSSCPAGSEYVVVFGKDRCMEPVAPLRYAPGPTPVCSAGQRQRDIVNGIADRCCVAGRCDLEPSCDDGVLYPGRGDDQCVIVEGELESPGAATCPEDRPIAHVDLRHPTVDSCCSSAGDCLPLVAAGTCPEGSIAVSLIGPDACMVP